MVIFFYFEIFTTFALITFTLNIRSTDEFLQSISELFLCEQGGFNPDNPCTRSDVNRFHYPELSAISQIIFGSFPIVNLIFAINIQDIKQCFSKIRSKDEFTTKSSATILNTNKTKTFLSTEM